MGIIAVCPGSFDPVTLGHVDIIRRASGMFERVIVAIMTNTAKRTSFTVDERMDMIRRSTAGIGNIEVDVYGGLLADYVRMKGAGAIVKGLRAVSDFEYEFQMALTNIKLNPAAETVFFTARGENMYLSSSIVKSVAGLNGDISDFVPACIHEMIQKRLSQKGDA